MDIRCHAKKHAEINDGVLEIMCKSRWCGGPGVVVIHRWDVATGKGLKDKRFRKPIDTTRKASPHGSHNHSAAVRNS